MKVLDKMTGATLESNNELVTSQWVKRPERYSPVQRGENPDKPLEKMTVPELEAYAALHGIGLDGSEKKEDKLAAIKQALAQRGE